MQNFYTIGKLGGDQPILCRNTHVFSDEPDQAGLPQPGEVLLQIFNEPWLALRYIQALSSRTNKVAETDVTNNPDFEKVTDISKAVLYDIDSPQSWDYYKGFARELMGAERAIVNPCGMLDSWHEKIFPIFHLALHDDFSQLLDILPSAEPCPVCYDKEEFMRTANLEGKTSLVKMGFDKTYEQKYK